MPQETRKNFKTRSYFEGQLIKLPKNSMDKWFDKSY